MTPEAACHEITNFAVVRAMDILAAAGPQLLISDMESVSHHTDAMVRFCCINTMWYLKNRMWHKFVATKYPCQNSMNIYFLNWQIQFFIH